MAPGLSRGACGALGKPGHQRAQRSSMARGRHAWEAHVSTRHHQQDLQTRASPSTVGSTKGPRLRLRLRPPPHTPDSTSCHPQFPNIPHNHSSNPPVLFFLKKGEEKRTNQTMKTRQPPGSPGHWACISVDRPTCPARPAEAVVGGNTSPGVGGANERQSKKRGRGGREPVVST